MKDIKGREVQVGDIIWIGRRNRNYGELVCRQVVEIKKGNDRYRDYLIVKGVSEHLDKWQKNPSKVSPCTLDHFIIDMEYRNAIQKEKE